jgi:4-deoxy-L-threo-5-hexosulose-uronate ketol-isomerase
MTAQDIRDTFVIGDLFQPGQVSMTYVEVDRAVVGSAAPLEPLPFPCRPTDAWPQAYFCERREVGVINIGGSGWIELDGDAARARKPRQPLCRPRRPDGDLRQ